VEGWAGLVCAWRGRAADRDAAIHLDLYLTGFNNIPTIGWLFLFQVTPVLFGIAVLVYGSRSLRRPAPRSPLATLGGYLLSLWVGLSGSRRRARPRASVAGCSR